MKINVDEFAKAFGLNVLNKEHEDIELVNSYVTRPGLQLAGYYSYFEFERIQLIGNAEFSYLASLDRLRRERRLKKLFRYDLPCVILTYNFSHETAEFNSNTILALAKQAHVTLLHSKHTTNKLTNKIISYLEEAFAPTASVHGVMMEVAGVGVLMVGKSGIGKSEIALELVKRGNRLVADDMVEIKQINEHTIMASCPKLLQYFMEIRGVGIIDIRALYGMGAINESVAVDVVVELEKWDDGKTYERIGGKYKTHRLFDIDIPEVTVPVTTGRNIAVIIETIARNFRVNQMHYSASETFCQQVEEYNLENAVQPLSKHQD